MSHLNSAIDEKVLVLTIDRDEKRNALNTELCMDIAELVGEITLDNEAPIRAVLIRGEGRAFCAGADLGKEDGGVYGGGFLTSLQHMLTSIMNCPVPVIADIQGPAVGAGVQLSLACDLRVVGEKAWFQVPPAKLGFALDNWTIRRCVQLLGGSVTRGVLLAAQKMDAHEAHNVGFVHLLGDADAALEYAHEVSRNAPLSMKHLKNVLNDEGFGFDLSPMQQQDYEAAWNSEDAKEARQARSEKRAPEFKAR
ncbi:enoyl-CoA hydratase [Corynebacterium hindlerae]|uniref:Enoyl-CoA hydratase n=1 Tax=Corynebacterium hindlerae TaxID=699041 RepID=A0A7G5FGV7_9CORY|nr:enoyl-CoA hydratase [Corynebacterium hindlerae]QMV85848.1 enoyl-CoA hydratase [Corynebacterium hindlerae]QTH60498.1 enoyl-CoA hydratase [Corynebacterium hindlerae]